MFKISFIDKVDPGAQIARHHLVQSYKKFNAMNTFDPIEGDSGQNGSHCCTIF